MFWSRRVWVRIVKTSNLPKDRRPQKVQNSRLELLFCRPDDDLVDVHLGWLLDGISDRTSD